VAISVGTSAADFLFGLDGRDRLYGLSGDDWLVFASGLETGSVAYIGSAAFSGGGNSEARFAGDGQIQVDDDGDGNVDQAFLMTGVTAANLLTATDFVWL